MTFLSENERKKRKNTQNVLLEGCYLLLDEYLQDIKKTTCLYPETVTKGGRLVKNITNWHVQYLEDMSRIPSIRV